MTDLSTPPGPSGVDAQQRYALLQAGLDLINQGLSVMDGNLCLVAWNKTFVELLEFPDYLIRVGTPFEAFIRYNAERGEYGTGDIDALVATRVHAARQFVPHNTERVRPNGSIINIRGEPIHSSGGFITIYTDITEARRYEELITRQNIELEARVRERTMALEKANTSLRSANASIDRIADALKRSEARMRLITDEIPALIAYTDRNLIYQFVNQGYANWFGRRKEEILGRSVAEIMTQAVFTSVYPHLQSAAQGNQVSYEYSMVNHQGRLVYARSSVVPDFDMARQVVGFFVLSVDITEEKQAQAALVQAQKMEAVGQLTGGIAHDFNNLLTIVLGNLGILRDQHIDLPAINEFVEPAIQASERGVALIKRLLAFSRQQPLEPHVFEVAQLVTNVTQLLHHSLPANIHIQTRFQEPHPHILADPHQLESALINIAVNARDAMPEGGKLHIDVRSIVLKEEDARALEITAGEYAVLEVTDSGNGMDAVTLARSLEPFFSTKPFGAGSGLGLPMVYGFVRQSGGGMRLTSTPGQGTIVTLWLPLSHAIDQAIVPTPINLPAPGAHKMMVLLVEDEPEVRRIVRLQLTELGHPVLEAHNGSEAARLLESVPGIGLLVSDVVMPGDLDGHALVTQARALRPDLRVILMSGYADNPAPIPIEHDNIRLLAKPFTKDDIAHAIVAIQTSPRYDPQ